MSIEDHLPELIRYLRANSVDPLNADHMAGRDLNLANRIGTDWEVRIDIASCWITGTAKELSQTAEEAVAAGLAVRAEILRILDNPELMHADIAAVSAFNSKRRVQAWLGVAKVTVPLT